MNDYFRKMDVVWRTVKDWEAAKTFYGETLGLPVSFGGDDYGWIEYGAPESTKLAISRWDGERPLPQGHSGIPVFAVDDVDAAITALRSRGVRCDDVEHIPGLVQLGTFYDPDGNPIQLAQPPA